jgi:hypothetical protein
MIRIERNPPRKQLLLFGLCWLVFFGFWGASSWLQAGINYKAIVSCSLALVVPVAGLLWPAALRAVYLAAAYITLPIGIVISFSVLVVIYYLVLTPIGIAMRLAGYDPMKRTFDPDAGTYWTARKPTTDQERYFKQF